MPDFRKLRVWQAAEDLAVHAFRVANSMRGARSATVSDQLIRAAMSVPANIVEGNAHTSPRERARYLGYAVASIWEVEGHVQLSSDLRMITTKDHDELLAEIVNVRKMLYGLLKTIRTWDKQKPQRPVR
jgi:four helix bundle protein